MKLKKNKIYIYDTTLRDGGQTSFVDFTLKNKLDLANKLDDLGVDFIEAGWPGANPIDSEFFINQPKLKNSKLCAFGMTYRASLSPQTDIGFKNLLDAKIGIVTLVGKSWDFQVKETLNISLKQNIKLIEESIKAIQASNKKVFFDAEHFFDGFKENSKYSIEVIEAAYLSGAEWIILCDTNGGSLPSEIYKICSKITELFPKANFGIHCHNDTGNAVANSLAAIDAGIKQVQGTLNGLGERCGNANLTTIIPTLKLKTNFDVAISDKNLKNLKTISNYLCDILNYPYDAYAPYVGAAAFSHKGGLHASAMLKSAKSYEHIDPKLVGNSRNILVSNQSGKAAITARLNDLDFKFPEAEINNLTKLVKSKEYEGFSYDLAGASFALLAYRLAHKPKEFYNLESYKVVNERRINAKGGWVTTSDAVIKLTINHNKFVEVAEGNGPVAALDNAIRKILIKSYPQLTNCKLTDYKVRILDSESATSALIRVVIETSDNIGNRWISIGVGTDIIAASYLAIKDSIDYVLLFGKGK
ncbi:MAG: citramalate synthase [Rickettsiales bacterium]|nr:citramalate synthase [Rickettsiales bacterium]